MATSRSVSVTTSATRLDTPGQAAIGVESARQALAVYNAGSVTIYLGGSDVTSANGIPVTAGQHYAVAGLTQADALYAIAASGSQDVRVLEAGL